LKDVKEIRNVFYNGYVEGALKVIDVLEQAMKDEGINVCKAEWLKSAREEFEAIRLNNTKES
jgi:hypothetical protein